MGSGLSFVLVVLTKLVTIFARKSSSKFATLSGYISGCDVPDFIKLSPGAALAPFVFVSSTVWLVTECIAPFHFYCAGQAIQFRH